MQNRQSYYLIPGSPYPQHVYLLASRATQRHRGLDKVLMSSILILNVNMKLKMEILLDYRNLSSKNVL